MRRGPRPEASMAQKVLSAWLCRGRKLVQATLLYLECAFAESLASLKPSRPRVCIC